jgi:hypothetical protein
MSSIQLEKNSFEQRLSPLGKPSCYAKPHPGIDKWKSGDKPYFYRLQVCLNLLLLQIKFPFELA